MIEPAGQLLVTDMPGLFWSTWLVIVAGWVGLSISVIGPQIWVWFGLDETKDAFQRRFRKMVVIRLALLFISANKILFSSTVA